MKEFKTAVLKALQVDHDRVSEWQAEAPKTVEQSRPDLLDKVLDLLSETIGDVEELDDGPPLQDETELAHNELDLHEVPRLSDADGGQGNVLPLWFRIKKLVERDGPPSLQKTLESAGEPPHIHVPTGKRFPTQMVAGILDSVFNNDQVPLANYAAKLMANSKACETCDHFYDASLDDCPNPKCPAEYITDELEPLEDDAPTDHETEHLTKHLADPLPFCPVCRERGRLSSLETVEEGGQVCLRCDWRTGEPVE